MNLFFSQGICSVHFALSWSCFIAWNSLPALALAASSPLIRKTGRLVTDIMSREVFSCARY